MQKLIVNFPISLISDHMIHSLIAGHSSHFQRFDIAIGTCLASEQQRRAEVKKGLQPSPVILELPGDMDPVELKTAIYRSKCTVDVMQIVISQLQDVTDPVDREATTEMHVAIKFFEEILKVLLQEQKQFALAVANSHSA